jgi:PAS domain-containing protein
LCLEALHLLSQGIPIKNLIADEDYYHPDYLEYAHNKIKESVKYPDITIPALFQVKHKDGRYIWLEGVLNNRLDDPSIAGIITNFRDITNQINIELKLKQREQRFQALIENNEGIISLVNRDKKSLFRTASAKRLRDGQMRNLIVFLKVN